MRFSPNIEKIQLLHPAVRQEVTDAINYLERSIIPENVALHLDYTLRTFQEQNDLYALGRTKRNPEGLSKNKPLGNIVTNASGGRSWHNYGLAFDFNWFWKNGSTYVYNPHDSWSVGPVHHKVTLYFKSLGWEWGGDWEFKDTPHLEKRFGYKEDCSQLLKKYQSNDLLIPGTTYINL